jgi:hypothetical protein
MRIKYFCILLIIFLVCCCQKKQEVAKYEMSYYEDKYEKILKIFDDNNNDIIRLTFDEKGAISSLHTDYEGFYLSAGRLNGEFVFLVVRDENTMFQELTQLNREDNVLVYRMEQYKTFSNEYRRFEDGKINIKNWDYINEKWLESDIKTPER